MRKFRNLGITAIAAAAILILSAIWAVKFYTDDSFHDVLTRSEDFYYKSAPVPLERQFFTANFLARTLSGSETVTLMGRLHLPRHAAEPMPAVIFQHGSGGNSLLASWYQDIIAALNAHDIAVLIADSHSARGLTSTANDQTLLPSATRLLDTAQALKALAADSRIRADRIAIAGDSYGAFIAMRLAETDIIRRLAPHGERFVAHALLYPACNGTPEKIALTGAPIMFWLGGRDDYTYAEDCLAYIARLKQYGYDVAAHIFPQAYHGWLYNIPPVKFPGAQTFNGCRIIFSEDGNFHLPDYHITSEAMDLQQFYATVLASGCTGLGAHVGNDRQARRESLRQLVAFFVRTLRSPAPAF